jgi:hypothetical protein
MSEYLKEGQDYKRKVYKWDQKEWKSDEFLEEHLVGRKSGEHALEKREEWVWKGN